MTPLWRHLLNTQGDFGNRGREKNNTPRFAYVINRMESFIRNRLRIIICKSISTHNDLLVYNKS